MARAFNPRQIEALKAVIDHGMVSRAAQVLTISQTAAGKPMMQLDSDNFGIARAF